MDDTAGRLGMKGPQSRYWDADADETLRQTAFDANMRPVTEILTLVRECAAKLRALGPVLPSAHNGNGEDAAFWANWYAESLEATASDAQDEIAGSIKRAVE